MKLDALCPICVTRIDENVARLNGLWSVIILLVSYFTASIFPVFFLVVDFGLRGAKWVDYSPLAILSKWVIRRVNITPRNINAGPKLFAARIGFLFTLAIFVSLLIGETAIAFYIGAVLGLFASLEAAFSFCVACQIYPFLYRLSYQKQTV